ncbi:unnamed protein product [Triticum turgidum subsp. durum]|uniref:CCT domain-containing protein n=1 Tax=Triticum turgidum subsp. durum TaxID=4567 RepID=A0A9R0SHH8_TRITD|nr:unnamed protein product [Triticum turgidum subsp. durum]
MAGPTAYGEKSTTVAAKRVASLMRFREKRKERCFDKKIRYGVRKEVAQKYRLNPCPFSCRCFRRVISVQMLFYIMEVSRI